MIVAAPAEPRAHCLRHGSGSPPLPVHGQAGRRSPSSAPAATRGTGQLELAGFAWGISTISRTAARTRVGNRRPGNCGQNAREDLSRARWATGHGHVNRYHVRYPTTRRVTLTEDSAGATAVADRDDQLRVGRRVVRSSQRDFHVSGHWPGDEQHVRVPWACDEANAKTFEIVEWVAECVHFQFAAVAGTCVDSANAQCATQHVENARLQCFGNAQRVVSRWRWFCGNSGAVNLA